MYDLSNQILVPSPCNDLRHRFCREVASSPVGFVSSNQTWKRALSTACKLSGFVSLINSLIRAHLLRSSAVPAGKIEISDSTLLTSSFRIWSSADSRHCGLFNWSLIYVRVSEKMKVLNLITASVCHSRAVTVQIIFYFANGVKEKKKEKKA